MSSAISSGDTNVLRTLVVTEDHLFGALGPVMLVVWRRETSLAGVQELRAQLAALGAAHPQGTAIYIVVEEGAPPPGTAARRALGETLREAPGVKACALVYEGKGLRAAVVRSVVATVVLVTGNPYPYHVFSEAGPATEWLCGHLPGSPVRPDALGAAVATLRGTAP